MIWLERTCSWPPLSSPIKFQTEPRVVAQGLGCRGHPPPRFGYRHRRPGRQGCGHAGGRRRRDGRATANLQETMGAEVARSRFRGVRAGAGRRFCPQGGEDLVSICRDQLPQNRSPGDHSFFALSLDGWILPLAWADGDDRAHIESDPLEAIVGGLSLPPCLFRLPPTLRRAPTVIWLAPPAAAVGLGRGRGDLKQSCNLKVLRAKPETWMLG